MDYSVIVMWVGFFLASYSVVGNDVIQTLGTFLTSNEDRAPWWTLWLFAAGILSIALIYGFLQNDISYGRLERFTAPEVMPWYYLLPPIVLLLITRSGIPVSTTFMILTLFSIQDLPADLSTLMGSIFDTEQKLGGMIYKSVLGYIIALSSGLIIFTAISRFTERIFVLNPIPKGQRYIWTIIQWCTTAFLWFQWLSQDLANIYVYFGGGDDLNVFEFIVSLFIIVGLLGYIFYRKGGAVQDIVRSKFNTADIRSATFIDLIYGIILYIFKYDYFGIWGGKIPMSTTWIFVGLLAGREMGIVLVQNRYVARSILNMLFSDLGKIFFGLVVSIGLVFLIKYLTAII
ncbi:MAG: hypothetical protein GVX78_01910 [Bacteroidetes bacterium]|jgi:hypothetical protein|nr:hypothetical protein [Bacteroidota bacterium]